MTTFNKITFFISLIFPLFSLAKLEVAATTTDLAALVREVGGDAVEVFAIAKGTQDPHQVEAKPSFMVKLRNADLVIAQGLELESAWIIPLIRGARNPKLLAKEGLYELGAELDPLEVPKGDVSRAEGDVHPGGNPHFQLDPIRLGKAALLISKRLGELDPSHKDFFEKNAGKFQASMVNKTREWQARLKKTGLKELVTYHKNFTYFCERFELRCEVQLEPKPGIPPTTSHLLDVVAQMKARKIKLVLIENFYEDSVAPKLKQEIPNVVVNRVAISVDGEPGLNTNEKLIENLVKVIEEGSP
jgi:zinc/manganese transport system substrate-binding protein